jgi:hypothetical protein
MGENKSLLYYASHLTLPDPFLIYITCSIDIIMGIRSLVSFVLLLICIYQSEFNYYMLIIIILHYIRITALLFVYFGMTGVYCKNIRRVWVYKTFKYIEFVLISLIIIFLISLAEFYEYGIVSFWSFPLSAASRLIPLLFLRVIRRHYNNLKSKMKSVYSV